MPGEKGWVTSLCQVLRIVLSQRLGRQANIWMDDGESLGKSLCDETLERLENAAAVVAVITPRYLRSKWCLRELEMFKLKISNNHGNLYPVYRFPIGSRDELPDKLQDIIGYPFYNANGGMPLEFEPDRQEFLMKVIQMAADIALTIKGK
jgi:hypothetical protein